MTRLRLSREADARDSGSAVVEFVLVGTLVVLIGLALLQLVLALHVRNTVASAAIEGARVSAQADRTPGDGIGRAEELALAALPGYAVHFTASETTVDGLPMVTITGTADRPVVGFWGPGTLTVQGRAVAEPVP